MTNGSSLLAEVDGRSLWARRMRDVMALHISDLGGPDAISQAELSIVRRIAVLTVELETLEQAFATDGHASQRGLDLYTRTAGHHRRMIEAIGLQRRARDVTPPTISQFIEANS